MFLIIVLGLITVTATVLVHAIGTSWWLHRLKSRPQNATEQVAKRSTLFAVLLQTALVLITLHVIEVFLWAIAFLLSSQSGLRTLEEAIYFSFTTFTTLGYGDITLAAPWRLLTGIESLNGVLLIGWSTALSFAVIERVWEKMEET